MALAEGKAVRRSIRAGARGARQYMRRGEEGSMGVDVSAGQIGDQYTSAFDEAGRAAGERVIGGDWAARQKQLADMQLQTALGQGPSVAGNLLQQGSERAIAAQRSAVASAAPGSRGLVGRAAQSEMSRIGQETAMGAANIRQQEMQSAQENLMNTLGMGRGQDIQAQQMNDQLTQFYMEQGFTRDAAQAQANMAMEEMIAGNWRTMMSSMLGQQESSDGVAGGILGALGTLGAGGLIAASDENVKRNVKDATKLLDDFVSNLDEKEFEYNDEPGKKTYGIMAQSLEKSKVGKSLVKKVKGVKHVDVARGMGTALAALKRLADRVGDLEVAHAG